MPVHDGRLARFVAQEDIELVSGAEPQSRRSIGASKPEYVGWLAVHLDRPAGNAQRLRAGARRLRVGLTSAAGSPSAAVAATKPVSKVRRFMNHVLVWWGWIAGPAEIEQMRAP